MKDNRPPKEKRTLKRGDVRSDGMVFWKYSPTYKNGEIWINVEKFNIKKLEKRKDNRIPPEERKLSRGMVRDDGLVFWEYSAGSKGGERWLDRDKFNERMNARRFINRTWQQDRMSSDCNFRLLHNIRCRTREAIKMCRKSASTEKLIGCSLDFLRDHLKHQFTNGMSWENYGEWHVDHVKPCASFDLSIESEQKACFHYTNLQPLWGVDNLRKGDKY